MPGTYTAAAPAPVAVSDSTASDRSWFYLRPLLQTLGFLRDHVAPERCGCVISNSKFGLDYFLRQYPEAHHDSHFIAEILGHGLAQKTAQHLTLQGPCLSLASACATGLHGIILGAQRIIDGEADVMLCAAAEAAHIPVIEAAFKSLGVFSRRGLCTPFDRDRDGFIMNEGAGLCVLQRQGHRVVVSNWESIYLPLTQITTEGQRNDRSRYRTIFVKGWGMTCDGSHAVHFDESGSAIAAAVEKALKMATLEPGDIDLVYVHGTGTVANDRIEAQALRQVFGQCLLSNIPMTSTKGTTGHLLGAAGAVEITLACHMLQGQFVYPTACLQKAPEFADLNIKMLHTSAVLRNILKLNYGFGGQIGALILGCDN